MIWLLGITGTPVDDLPDGALGTPSTVAVELDGREVGLITVEVHADASDLDDVRWLAPRALHHDEILTAAVACRVLPLAFGTAFASTDDALLTLRRHAEPVVAEFERLGGVDEYRARVAWPDSAKNAASGTEYLRRRRDRAREAENVAESVVERVRSVVTSVEASDPGDASVELVVLASPGQWSSVPGALDGVADRLQFEGPLPPYHFVDLEIGGTLDAGGGHG